MVTDWVNPYQTINKVNDDPSAQFWLSFRKQIVGGLGNPIKYNQLTGEPMYKVAQLGSSNYWQGTAATFFNELAVPGRTSDAVKNDPVFNELNYVNYDKSLMDRNIRSYKGIPLSAEEQSKLSQDMNKYGELRKRLKLYFEGKYIPDDTYPEKKRMLEQNRENSAIGDTSDGSWSAEYRDQIHQDIDAIWSLAKSVLYKMVNLAKILLFK